MTIANERVKKMLAGAHKNNRVPHAYLFAGPNLEEMMTTAKDLAGLLSCNRSCDLIIVSPQEKSSIIKIDQIRELQQIIKYGASEGHPIVCIVADAADLKSEAANSFLRTLEDPPKGVHFVLITCKEDAILKTIASRCQKIIFSSVRERYNEDIELPDDQSISGLLKYSSALNSRVRDEDKKREQVVNRLYGLAEKYFEAEKAVSSKIVLRAAKDIKRKANIKLALDNMALSLGGHIN